MHKKNTPISKNSHKPSSSRLAKFAITTSIIANILTNNPSFWQDTKQQTQQQTKTEIIDATTYDYHKLLHTDISTLSPEIIKKVMLDRINEIRKEKKIKPLKYDKRLESLAYEFVEEKNWTERWKDPYCHFDKDGNWIYERTEKKWLINKIRIISIDGEVVSLWENLVTTYGSVYDMLESLMASTKWHKERILSSHQNKVWFGYKTWSTIFVQIFAQMID
ncbi:MAG: hypothetical protein ACD_80C00166G0006 [uncultured bacterium (gcode 4)]|uniref:SCP domain-containing protein n=1 Tax=uncultured bacterium (gcode 4) TaxID=1234023 RepID=K1X3V0_9BACT|nr:MAG: hypothetical protein ACD_80C00166G0006 [uncultured bacterium (gcode 4)]